MKAINIIAAALLVAVAPGALGWRTEEQRLSTLALYLPPDSCV